MVEVLKEPVFWIWNLSNIKDIKINLELGLFLVDITVKN